MDIIPKSLAILSIFCVCSSTSAQGLADDTLFDINQVFYRFNETVDGYLVKPVALSYKAVVPRFAKRAVKNFLNNIDDINVIVNDLLQFKFRNALKDSSRFVMNTTVGICGLIDVAAEMGLYKNYEDFGQTLAYWGVGSGPYLIIPLLGSSTVRDALGLVPDLFFNPIYYIKDSKTRMGVYGVDIIDTRVSYLAAESMIAGDKYSFVRDAYLQRRAYLIVDGEIEDEFDDF